MIQSRSNCFVLCFRSLSVSGRGYAFPCDASGRVDLDQLSEHARINYLYARAMVGRELGAPVVEAAEHIGAVPADKVTPQWPSSIESALAAG